MEPAPTFVAFPRQHGQLADLGNGPLPSRLLYQRDAELQLPADASHFGLVFTGTTRLSCSSGTFDLAAGMYFAVPGSASLSGTSECLIASRLDHDCPFQIGGPIERRGRLRYIDGCTDSLLVSPAMLGDPCLNLLHIPRHTRQSQHTHPSIRFGMIVRGSGHCVTPAGRQPLHAGSIFLIERDGLHSFHTDDDELLVLAWHPDSDYGPTHEDHPMRNRTILPSTSPRNAPA